MTQTKRWDGEKVKHQKMGQYGWPDKKGEVWCPAGTQGAWGTTLGCN